MIIAVFFGLFNALNSWLKMNDQELRAELIQNRIAETEKLVANTDQYYFLTDKVLPLLKFICETPDVDIEKIQLDYLNRYDLDLSIFLFDKSGNLEQVVPKRAPNQWLMKNLFPYLIEKDFKEIEKGSQQLNKKIEFTFGYGKDLISLREKPEIIINSVSSGEECFFTWTHRSPKSALIFGNRLPNPQIMLKAAEAKIKKDKDFLFEGKIEDKSTTKQELESTEASNYFSRKSMEYGIYNNQEWYFASNKNGEKYYTSYKLSSNVYSRCIIFLRFLFLLLVTLSLFIVIKITANFNLSLKQMVLLIFLASTMIPLGTISSESFENIKTYSDIYTNEIKSSLNSIINSNIQNFENYITSCSDKLKKITEPKNGIYDFIEIEKNIAAEFPDFKFSLRNAACETIYANHPQYSPGQNTLFKALAKITLKHYQPERLDELPYKGNEFAEGMVSRDDLGFINITNNPNKLQFIYNTGIKMLLFIKVYPKTSKDVAVLYTELSIPNTLKQYIKSIDKRSLVLNQQQINLLALDPLGFRWIIPPQTNNSQYLEQAKAAFITGKPIFRKIKENNKSFYSLCVSNSEYNEVCYLGSISIEKLEKEILKKKMMICICAIIALILFSVITTWIMSQLIRPLSDLEKGIAALEKRNYETKIEVPQGKDEFVQLFKEFNYMMGENYDMQMAKNVQEGIITTLFPKVDNYLINGCTYPIDKLNSNCLTSFKMPDNNILFIIGNITGIGIGSALMMAFIRSITFHWSQKIQNNPVSLIDAIERILKSNRTKNMYIGLVCGILNTENGEIKYVTRGQIYPLFIRQNKKCEWLGQPSLPIGTDRKTENRLIETRLLPDDRMLCLTNGIIEINCSKETNAYDLVEKWATQTSNENNENWLENIKQKYDEFCALNNTRQTSDITLFSIITEKQEGNKE